MTSKAEKRRNEDLAEKIIDYWNAPSRRGSYKTPVISLVPFPPNSKRVHREDLRSNMVNGYPPRRK